MAVRDTWWVNGLMTTTQIEDDEIDLKELFAALWRGKWIIFAITGICLALGSAYLHQADRLYTVTYTLKPVSDEGSGNALQGLGGLASLAGVSLPTSGSGDFASYKKMLTSQEAATRLVSNQEIMQFVFASEWDEGSQSFKQPVPGQIGSAIRTVKKALTGDEPRGYRAPDAARLAQFAKDNLSLSEDKDTGFLTLSMELVTPEDGAMFMAELTEEVDTMFKERFMAEGQGALQFYQEKLTRARSIEHREQLAKLIAQEEQKQMLASREGPFVAEKIMGPAISLGPTSPKSSLVLALSIVLGMFFGAALVLVRSALRSGEEA